VVKVYGNLTCAVDNESQPPLGVRSFAMFNTATFPLVASIPNSAMRPLAATKESALMAQTVDRGWFGKEGESQESAGSCAEMKVDSAVAGGVRLMISDERASVSFTRCQRR
jgi:hypothetical protein